MLRVDEEDGKEKRAVAVLKKAKNDHHGAQQGAQKRMHSTAINQQRGARGVNIINNKKSASRGTNHETTKVKRKKEEMEGSWRVGRA